LELESPLAFELKQAIAALDAEKARGFRKIPWISLYGRRWVAGSRLHRGLMATTRRWRLELLISFIMSFMVSDSFAYMKYKDIVPKSAMLVILMRT
jgi:hypothetical protein